MAKTQAVKIIGEALGMKLFGVLKNLQVAKQS